MRVFFLLLVVISMLGVSSSAMAIPCSFDACTRANSLKVMCDCGTSTIEAGKEFCFAEQNYVGSQDDCLKVKDGLPPSDFELPGDDILPSSGAEALRIVQHLSRWTFALLMTISIIYVIVAAFEFVTGQGKPEKMNSARERLIYAAIGLAISLVIFGLPYILRSIIGVN